MALTVAWLIAGTGIVKLADHMCGLWVLFAPARLVPPGLRTARRADRSAWSPVFAVAARLMSAGRLARVAVAVFVQVAFRAPVLSSLQAIALLALYSPPNGTMLRGGVCSYTAGSGPLAWLLLLGATTAVVSMALSVTEVLAMLVVDRVSDRTPERRSGLVWTRSAPMSGAAADGGLIDPLAVVPAMIAATVLAFSALYVCLFQADPRGFHVVGCHLGAVNALYFSVVTAATVGFGDISPVSEGSQIAVLAQIVVTAFGLGLFIASIVGPVRRQARR